MTEGVKDQETAIPGNEVKPQSGLSDKEMNFRKLETDRNESRERAMRAEYEAALLKQKIEMYEKQNAPKEADPLEGVEDYIDPNRYKADQARRDARLKKEAEDIARRTYAEEKREDDKKNHVQRLKSEFSDFDQIMTEKNIVHFEQTNPEFLQTVQYVTDDYERKKLAYTFFKRNLPAKEEQRQSIKEKVEENARNPYYIPAGSGTPSAVDFDLKSPQARKDAYEKLKAAQRRPIGGGLTPSR